MGVPDEVDGPIRKRPRLSLHKPHKPALNNMTESDSTEMVLDKTEGPSQSLALQDRTLGTNECIDLTADLPASADPLVGPVASLHNLGNTCFLNSVLEVLRYTPGFVEGLGTLQKDIRAFENRLKDEEGSEPDLRPEWQVVKNIFTMFAEMDSKEEQYKEIATSDASSMAVRPSGLLDNIRELNPMFEGHFQHDAQELLRCLLCYIEDADKELKQERDKEKIKTERDKQLPDQGNRNSERITNDNVKKLNTAVKQIESTGNGISLKGGDSRRGDGSKGSSGRSRGKERPINAAASSFMENFLGGKNHKCQLIGKKEKADESLGKVENVSTVNSEIAVKEDEVDGLVIVNGVDRVFSHYENGQKNSKNNLSTISSSDRRGRKRRRSRSNSNSKKNVPDKEAAVKNCSTSKPGATQETENKRSEINSVAIAESNREKAKDEVSESESSSGNLFLKLQQKLSLSPTSKNVSKPSAAGRQSVGSDPHSSKQPSILSMFPLNQVRRLGMRGRVIFDSVSRAITKASDENTGNESVSNDSNNNANSNGTNNGDSNNNGDNSDSNNNDDYNNNNHSNNNNSNINFNHVSSSPNTTNHIDNLVLGHSMETDTSSINSENDVISGSNSLTPTKKANRFHSQSPIKSPVKSPMMVEHSNEISPLQDKEMISIESTIDSVTKKYYSTLPQSRRRAASPSKPSLPPVPSSPKLRGSTNFELVIPDPETLASDGKSENSAVAASPHHQLEPDEELIVHSPSKMGLPFNVPVRSSPRKRSELSSSNTEDSKRGEALWSQALSTALQNMTPETVSAKLSKPLSVTTDEFLHFEKNTQAFLHSLQAGRWPGTRSASAPNSPADNYLKHSRAALQSPQKLSSGGEVVKSSTPGTNNCRNNSPLKLKLELKKCDWLGVSPAKSISARKALSAMNSQSPPKFLDKSILSARRKIVYDHSEATDNEHIGSVLSKLPGNQSQLPVSSFFAPLKRVTETEKGAGWSVSQKESPSSSETVKSKTVPTLSASTRRARQRPPSSSQPLCKSSKTASHRKNSGKSGLFEPVSSLTLTKGITLRPLSVSLDNCDWLLDAKAGKPVSAKKALKDLKKCSSVNYLKTLSNTDYHKVIGEESGIENKALSVQDIKQESHAKTLVEQLFGGTMMHRTKCLECEKAKERCEMFMDISVPVRGLDEGDEDSDDEKETDDEKSKDSCLAKLMQAFSSVERLKGSNKYFCEECEHYVEAERSCHYTTLPAVLTLHLKRFSANSGLFGGVSKLNDKVTIPQNLPCLRYQCKKTCTDPDHQYSLFAIVTHSGMSILHGHYRAYVKVQPQFNPIIFHSLLMSMVKDENMDIGQIQEDDVLLTTDREFEPSSLASKDKIYTTVNKNSNKQSCAKNSRLSKDSHTENGMNGVEKKIANGCTRDEQVLSTPRKPESFWLECDDECIKVMEESEFADKLEERDGSLMGTPYLLFYHKLVMS